MITLDDDLTDRGVECLFGSGQSVTGGRGGREERLISCVCFSIPLMLGAATRPNGNRCLSPISKKFNGRL